mgnify:FL=1
MIFSKTIKLIKELTNAIFISIVIISCTDSVSEDLGSDEPTFKFDYTVQYNDLDMFKTDSLSYEIAYNMSGFNEIDLTINIDSLFYKSLTITNKDSLDYVYADKIPLSNNGIDISMSFAYNDSVIAENYHNVPVIKPVKTLTLSLGRNGTYFDRLFDKSKFIINDNIIFDQFTNYDFGEVDIVIINDLDTISDKTIVQLQKFLLGSGWIFVVMNDDIKSNNDLYYSLGYPKGKAIRGSSRNQFFSIDRNEFLSRYSFSSQKLVKQSEIYRYFQFKNNENEFANIMISTGDPLLIEKDILGGKIFFLTTKTDSNWSNDTFNKLLDNMLHTIFFQRLLSNES